MLIRLLSLRHIREKLVKNLHLAAIGGIICYSTDNVSDFLIKNVDKRLKNNDEILKYINKLIKNRHYSVLEHCIIPVSKQNVLYFIRDNNITISEIIKEIDKDLYIIFELLESNLEQTYPIYDEYRAIKENLNLNDIIKDGNTTEINAFFKLFILLCRYKLNNISYDDKYIYFNLRHFVELLEKENNYDIDKTISVFNKKISQVLKNEYKIDRIRPLKVEKINDTTNLYILKIITNNEKVVGVTYIIENCSRVLTHQLVRHRLFCSYSQKSLRYTKIKDKNGFVYPILDYIKEKDKVKEFKKEYEDVYEETLNKYNYFLNNGINKEDARFILPNSVNTTIMVTMVNEGLDNFLNLRTKKDTQWELRNIAIKLKEILNK